MAAWGFVERQAALDALLHQHPDARVVAIAPSALVVPMPADVHVAGRASLDGVASMLDVVHPSQAKALIRTWELMKLVGEASVTVRAWHDQDCEMGIHFIDMVGRHGVVICVVTGYEEAGVAPGPAAIRPLASVIRKDEMSYITDVDDAAVAILGWPADELVGLRSHDLIHPDDEEYAVGSWLRMLARPGSASQVRVRQRHRDGAWRWLEITNHNNLAVPGDPHILAEMVDVTAEVHAVDALRTNERMLRRLTEALPIGVLYIEADRRISYRNARFRDISGIESAHDIDAQLTNLSPSSRGQAMDAVDAALTHGTDADADVSFEVVGGGIRRCVMSLRPVTNNDGLVVGAITCLTDITEDAIHREDLERRVRYDPLTACLNHASILDELQRYLDDPRPGTWTVVVFIDLDEFKETNDRYGHLEGDRLLKHVAAQLWQVAGTDGLVGRVGGDEFLMVLRAPADSLMLMELAARAAGALDAPVALRTESIRARGSIGVAYSHGLSPQAGNAADLVAAADAAMYRSKRTRDGTPIVAHPDP